MYILTVQRMKSEQDNVLPPSFLVRAVVQVANVFWLFLSDYIYIFIIVVFVCFVLFLELFFLRNIQEHSTDMTALWSKNDGQRVPWWGTARPLALSLDVL